jgi:hypothetical protein
MGVRTIHDVGPDRPTTSLQEGFLPYDVKPDGPRTGLKRVLRQHRHLTSISKGISSNALLMCGEQVGHTYVSSHLGL